jgi:amino acid transporter
VEFETKAGRSAAESSGSLDRSALGLGGVLFQGITHIAPALVIFALPFIVSEAGAGAALSFLVAVLLMVPIASTVAQFSKYVSSSGGYYTYVSRGLGPRWGFMTGWNFLAFDPLGPAAALGFLGFLTQDILKTSLGWSVPWWIIALVALGLTWIAALRGVALSAKAMMILGGLELAIMVVLMFTFFFNPAPNSSMLASFRISSSPTGLHGIIYGVLFSILSVSGYESIATLAEETRNAFKFIFRAVYLSLLIVGAYEVLISVAVTSSWGSNKMSSFVTNANPFYTLAKHLWGPAWVLVFFAIVNSALGVSIASFNSGSRVIFSMGRAGTLPKFLAKVHPMYKTPHNAILAIGILSIALIVGVGNWVGASLIFGFLGEIITISIILMYIAGNCALTRYVFRNHRQDFKSWLHALLPTVGSLLLLPVIYVTFHPFPAYPFNVAPFFVVAWLLIGLVLSFVIEKRNPGALSKGGDLFVGTLLSPIGEEGVSGSARLDGVPESDPKSS